MHRCTRKEYTDKIQRYRLQIQRACMCMYTRTYTYVYTYTYTRAPSAQDTRHKLLTVQDMVYLVLFVAYGGYSCLLGARPRAGVIGRSAMV